MCGSGLADGKTQLETGIKRSRNPSQVDTKLGKLSKSFGLELHKDAKIGFRLTRSQLG
jgi:hypothetical protein